MSMHDTIFNDSDNISSIPLQLSHFVIIDHLPIAAIHLDLEWNCLHVNGRWTELTQNSYELSIGQGWTNCIVADDVSILFNHLFTKIRLDDVIKQDIRLITKNGEVHWVEFKANEVFDKNKQLVAYIGLISDVTRSNQFTRQLNKLSKLDPLTGLMNRKAFSDLLKQRYLRALDNSESLSLLIINIDDFKLINSTFGHHIGDKVIRNTGSRLNTLVAQGDVICRFNGDEFVILFNRVLSQSQINVIATNLINNVNRKMRFELKEISIQICIGGAKVYPHQCEFHDIFKQVEHALHTAKAIGKNSYYFYQSQIQSKTTNKRQLLSSLHQGLYNNKFNLVYQPIICAKTGNLVSMETLIRFSDDDKNYLMPDNFIPVLEESGLIIEVGSWIIETACKQTSQWIKSGNFPVNGYVSINVSAKQLTEKSFVSFVLKTIRKYDITPKNIVIEVTETSIISDPKEASKILALLRQSGIRIALDDFGTGYCSLNYLQQYNFDVIKIDKSFINNLANIEQNLIIVNAIIGLAQSFGLIVVAEGVEDENQIGFLASLGVNFVQGFAISSPLKTEDMLDYMESQQFIN